MTIIMFILIFGVIVMTHEFGHFLLAKMNGIGVVEFSIGMGPKIIRFSKNNTEYSLRLLPIGGACMFEGEDGLEVEEGKSNGLPFQKANVWGRISTVLAGPVFNFILAFFLSLIMVGFSGTDRPVVTGLIEGYPAQQAGLRPGDELIRLNGERVHVYREVSFISMLNQGEPIEIEYKRDGEKYTTVINPYYDGESGRYYIGLSGGGEYVEGKGLRIIPYSLYEVRYWLKTTYKSLGMLINGQASKEDLAGPVGMVQVIDEAYETTKPYGISAVVLTMMNLAVLLSVNIGVLNLLPLPALDGGRLVFLLLEVVRGKPVPPEKEGMVHFAGFVALMILMVFVMYNDIMRIFS